MEILPQILEYLIQGGAGSIIALLFGAIVLLLFDRRNLTKSKDEITDKLLELKNNEIKNIESIVERYHQGNLNLVQALNEIKIVLVAIQNSKR